MRSMSRFDQREPLLSRASSRMPILNTLWPESLPPRWIWCPVSTALSTNIFQELPDGSHTAGQMALVSLRVALES